MELSARPVEREVEERCPYCHDALVAPAEDLIACPGCATAHHRACVEELGRCTIRGCEQPLVATPEADAAAGQARRASVTEEIRRRLRDRVRRFVVDHASPSRPWAPVFEQPAASPEPEVGGQPPDVGRVQRFVARNAAQPTSSSFAARLLAAVDGARSLPTSERAARHRRVAELLRSPEAASTHGADEAEALAREHERRAEELEALLARVYRPGSLPAPKPPERWAGQDIMVLVLLALAGVTGYLMLYVATR